MRNGKHPKLGIAICTFDRAESLRKTLDSLRQQTAVDSDQWELWIVDNNSSDHTRAVCESYSKALPIRYLFEREQGLSSARNAVTRETRNDYLFFTDDDVSLGAAWLSEIFSAIERYPEAAYFGGRILPRWDVARPKWLRQLDMPLLSSLYCYFNPGDEDRAFDEGDPMPFGANMGFKVEALKSAGSFRTDLGPLGPIPGRGDDAEMILRMRSMNMQGIYLPTAVVYHEFSLKRFSLPYLFRYGREKGRAEKLMAATVDGTRRAQLAYAVKGLGQLIRGRGDRFRQCVINIGIQAGLMAQSNIETNNP